MIGAGITPLNGHDLAAIENRLDQIQSGASTDLVRAELVQHGQSLLAEIHRLRLVQTQARMLLDGRMHSPGLAAAAADQS